MPKCFRSPGRVSLYQAAGLVQLHKRSRSNWNPLLFTLCESAKPPIHVGPDSDGVPCIDRTNIPRLAELVRQHFNRPRYAKTPPWRDQPIRKV